MIPRQISEAMEVVVYYALKQAMRAIEEGKADRFNSEETSVIYDAFQLRHAFTGQDHGLSELIATARLKYPHIFEEES
jgi:hypothetical protein